MNPIISKVKAAYTKLPVKKVPVPEWDVEMYYKQVKGDELDLMALETPERCTPTRSNAQVLIVKALDANGVRLFGNGDGDDLYIWADPEVINRVAKIMLSTVTVDDQVDFSAATPTS